MEDKRKPRGWLMLLVVGLALLVVYPLSVGPAHWCCLIGLIPNPSPLVNFLDRLYFPLIYVMEHDQRHVGPWIAWYLHVWS